MDKETKRLVEEKLQEDYCWEKYDTAVAEEQAERD